LTFNIFRNIRLSMQLFLDTEFTGLHQQAALISLALYNHEDDYFYAEFNDYDSALIGDWLKEHVINALDFHDETEIVYVEGRKQRVKGNSAFIARHLELWISEYAAVEIWADCYAWDWILFCELWGGSMNLPKNIFYIPMDLATYFKSQGVDPDVSRFEFVKEKLIGFSEARQHHALWDAKVERWCYDKLAAI
jgi:hypothetical protein